jgi:hypothetical protein
VRAAALVALLALACGSNTPTGIVVEVSSDLVLPADQDLHLRVFTGADTPVTDLRFRESDLPARFQLVPQGAATSVTVEATAPVGGLSRRATVSFRPGALLLLRLPLEAACVCHPCNGGETCEGGNCEPVVKAALPAYSPPVMSAGPKVAVSACLMDAAPPADGGDAALPPVTDAGIDAAAPPDAPVTDARSNPDVAAPPVDEAPPTDTRTAPDAPASPPDVFSPPDLPGSPPDRAADLAAPVDQALPPDAALPPDLPGLRADGQPCTTSDQCQSAACVDHVCCHTACIGPCLACDNLHTGAPSGQCAPALAGTDPDNDCAADVPMTCGYDGLCNGAGACRFYPATTQCAAATCNAASSFTPARNCTGAGACAAPAPQNCGLFLCTPTGCPATCQSQAACASTAYCNGSTCLAKKAALQPCAANYECQSNNCLINATCL